VLAPAIIHNVTLKKLDLSRNPLGSYGGRVIVHAYNNSKVQDREMIFQGCDLSLEDVKNVTDFNQFDPEAPSGHYRLDLSDRFQRAVAQRLVELSVVCPGENIKNEKINGQIFNIDEEDPDVLVLPHEGIMDFDYIETKVQTVETGFDQEGDLEVSKHDPNPNPNLNLDRNSKR